jgi:YHS domain-containing protein
MRIMKTSGLAGLCLFLLLSFAGNVFAAPQTTCPVMGGDINKEVYVDHEGKRIYFCCPACIPKFKEDPAKYLAKLKEMGEEPADIPAEGEGDEAAPAEHDANHEGHAEHAN